MRDVKAAAEKGDEQAQAALDVWTYRIQKYIGAYNVAEMCIRDSNYFSER